MLNNMAFSCVEDNAKVRSRYARAGTMGTAGERYKQLNEPLGPLGIKEVDDGAASARIDARRYRHSHQLGRFLQNRHINWVEAVAS